MSVYLADTYVSAVCEYVQHWLTFCRLKPSWPTCHLKPIRFKCLALPLRFSWPYFVSRRELGLSSCLWRATIAWVQGSPAGLPCGRVLLRVCVCVYCLPLAVTARMQWQQLQFVGNVLPLGPGQLELFGRPGLLSIGSEIQREKYCSPFTTLIIISDRFS